MPSSHPVKMSSYIQVHLVKAVEHFYSTHWIIMQETQHQGVRWSCVSGGVLLLPARLQTVIQLLANGLEANRSMAVMQKLNLQCH